MSRAPAPEAEADPAPAAVIASTVVKVTADAQKVYELVGPQLRRLNFLRDSDDLAFRRYCETMARYWRVTSQLDALGGETYECDTTAGGKMQRMRPEFLVQERLAKRLDGLEDRFGLTPMARQQFVLALQRQPSLPLDPPAPKPAPGSAADVPASAQQAASAVPPAIGGGRGLTH